MPSTRALWTVGHSSMPLGSFLSTLEDHAIEFLVDVRSHPRSRFVPQFNREALDPSLERVGIKYVFLGLELGGRPRRKDHLDDDGHALYALMAREPAFESAIDRLVEGCVGHRIAIMCSCGSPENCHRRLLVGKVLCDRGVTLRHILTDGGVFEETLVALNDPEVPSLFGDEERMWRSTRSVSRARAPRASSHA